jgi:hypothetical protein
MVIINDRRSEVVADADARFEKPSRSMSDRRRPWVAPTWERRDTPMEVTMYAGRR